MAKITGIHRVHKIQTKTTGANSYDSSQFLTLLQFNNLVVGRQYRITVNMSFRSTGVTDSGAIVFAYNANNSQTNQITSGKSQPAAGVNDDTIFFTKVFTAVNSTVSIYYQDSGSGFILGDANTNFAQLEELAVPSSVVTTDFT